MHSRLELIKGTAILFISSNLLWVTLNPRNVCKVFWLQIKQKYWSDHIFVPKKVEGTFWHWSILCFVWFVAILFANKQLILAKNPNFFNQFCIKSVSERFFATLVHTLGMSGNFRGWSHNSYRSFNSYHIWEFSPRSWSKLALACFLLEVQQ